MDAPIAARLNQLRKEFQDGQVKLRQLELEQDYLRERLLMIKGAIAVLEDLLTGQPSDGTSHGGEPAHAGAVAGAVAAGVAMSNGADRSRE